MLAEQRMLPCAWPRAEDQSLYWDNGKENGNYRDYRDYIGAI